MQLSPAGEMQHIHVIISQDNVSVSIKTLCRECRCGDEKKSFECHSADSYLVMVAGCDQPFLAY